jgi:hypothetical protein
LGIDQHSIILTEYQGRGGWHPLEVIVTGWCGPVHAGTFARENFVLETHDVDNQSQIK